MSKLKVFIKLKETRKRVFINLKDFRKVNKQNSKESGKHE